MEIIDRLQLRLQVSIQGYTAARRQLRTRQVWTALSRDTLHRALYGLQKIAGEIASHISVRPTHRPQLLPAVVAQLREVLRPGDVLVTRNEHVLTNYFLPGYWPHAA